MTPDITRFGRRLFAAVLIVALVVGVVYSIQLLLLVFAGILLGVLLRSSGTWLSRTTRLPINWSMAIVLVAFGTFFFGTILVFGGQIIGQADQLFRAVSEAYDQVRDKLAQYKMAGSLPPTTGGLDLESPARAFASGFIWVVASIVMVLFIGVYLSTNPQLYIDLFLDFFDRSKRKRVAGLLNDIGAALQWWLAGQFIAMAVVGVITTAGLLLIGAPMPISLGITAALLTFVPYVGAIISAIPAVLLAFTRSSEMAMYVLLIYLLAHIIEGYIIVPLVQHKLVFLPPAMILAMQFLMELFAGTVGVTLGTPLMVVAMVLIKELYFEQDWTEPSEGTDEAKAA